MRIKWNTSYYHINGSKNSSSTVNNNGKRIPDSINKSMICITSKLKEMRDKQGFVDEFDFHEYNYFVKSIPSHTGLGEFKDTPTIQNVTY